MNIVTVRKHIDNEYYEHDHMNLYDTANFNDEHRDNSYIHTSRAAKGLLECGHEGKGLSNSEPWN